MTQWELPSEYSDGGEDDGEDNVCSDAGEGGGTDSDSMPAVVREAEDELLHSMRPAASHGRRPLPVGAVTAGADGERDMSVDSPGANFSVVQLQDGVGFEGLQPSVWAADDGNGNDRAPAEVLSFDMGDEDDVRAGGLASDDDDVSDASSEPEWMEYVDEATGRPYYFNTVSGTTQWTPPVDNPSAVDHGQV